MAEVNAAPTAEDRAQYENLRKEILQALPKKRLVDKQLVRLTCSIPCALSDSLVGTDRGANLRPRSILPHRDCSAQRWKHCAGLRRVPQEPDLNTKEV